MILFPSRDEAIVSKMSPDEICEALSAVTIPRKEYRFWKKKPEFVGEVNTAGFKVTHPEKMYNIQLFALPVVTGDIRMKGRISIISIKIRMRWNMSLCYVLWHLAAAGFMLKGILAFHADRSDTYFLYWAGLMLCCGQWAFRSIFYLSARNTLEKMRKLFGKDSKNYTIS